MLIKKRRELKKVSDARAKIEYTELCKKNKKKPCGHQLIVDRNGCIIETKES